MASSSIPRERLPWFPTIDYDLCTSDLNCLNFCQHSVYEWDVATGRPFAAHPYNCVPGCDNCAQVCKAQAISFPSKQEFRATLRKLRGRAKRRAVKEHLID